MEELTLFRNAWNTGMDMMRDRGYVLLHKEYTELNDATFKNMVINDALDLIGVKQGDQTSAMYIKYLLPNEEKVKANQMKQAIDMIASGMLETYDSIEILIVLRNQPNINVMKIEKDSPYDIQIMWCKQLQFNITNHSLVPVHSRCDEEEINRLLSQYNITNKSQLPILSRDDPISRYYNFKSGDIIRISRIKTSVNQAYFTYRYVR